MSEAEKAIQKSIKFMEEIINDPKQIQLALHKARKSILRNYGLIIERAGMLAKEHEKQFSLEDLAIAYVGLSFQKSLEYLDERIEHSTRTLKCIMEKN